MKLESILENYPDETFLKADGFDEHSLRLIYSMSKCLDILMEDMSDEDALEHFYYNVSGAYVGEQTPIWCNDLD